jgi:hypothetical protein
VLAPEDEIYIVTTTHEDFYQFNLGATPGNEAGGPAFYETVIHKPGAVFDTISWDCRRSLLEGPGNTCMRVEVYGIDDDSSNIANALDSENANNEIDVSGMTFPSGKTEADYDKLRLKFIFSAAEPGKDLAEGGEFFPSPQLFEVRVSYYYPNFDNAANHDLAAPENFIYAKE